MQKPRKDGGTEREHLEAIYKMTGVMPDELKTQDIPESLSYLWSYYIDLKNAGDVNFLTIKSYSDLMAIDLTPSEVKTILDFEMAYRREM